MTLPSELGNYLISLTTQMRSPAFFQTSIAGNILCAGGELSKYGLEAVLPGEHISKHLDFLDAFFPLIDPLDPISGVKIEGDINVDIHFIECEGGCWILLLDSSREEEKQLLLQQKGNDLSLLRQKYVKLVNKVLDQSFSLSKAKEFFGLSPSGEWREVSLLLITMSELTDFSQVVSPDITLKTLNAYLTIITQVIVEGGGLINHILGETAVSFFGLIPSQTHASIQAIDAVRRLNTRLNELNLVWGHIKPSNIYLAAGITTGSVASGVVEGKSYRAFNAIGQNVLRSARMYELIQPGVLLIDETTYSVIDDYQRTFKKSPETIGSGTAESALYYQNLRDLD